MKNYRELLLEASTDENNAYFLAKTFSEFTDLIQN